MVALLFVVMELSDVQNVETFKAGGGECRERRR
jgi:hypothetical protein